MSNFSFSVPPSQPAASTGLSFGAPKPATTAGFGFGTNLTATPAAPVAAAPSIGFGFGTAPTAPPAATAQTTGFGFGTAQAAPPTATAQTAGFSFGTTPASGTTTTSTGLNFGVPAATATAAPSAGFGFGTGIPAPTTALSSAAPLNFNIPTVSNTLTKPAAPPTLSFGGIGGAISTATSALPTLGNTSFFGKPTTTSTIGAGVNFGTLTSIPVTAPPPFVGLGGVDVSTSQPKTGNSKQENVKVKETLVPEEIFKTVEALKTHNKIQKTLSSDIGRTSTSKLTNVTSEVQNLDRLLQEISKSVERHHNQIKVLRRETSKTIQSLEMAQRTQDTPAGLQFENFAPFQFFQDLIVKYENDLVSVRQQIFETESLMRSITDPQNVSPDAIRTGCNNVYDYFKSLTGQVSALHEKIETQKEQYLILRKYRLRDGTNVFAMLENQENKIDTSRITSGPTPFSNISAMSSFRKTFSNSSTTASGGNTTQTAK